MGITVTINDDSFDQTSTQGRAGETVTFTSNRPAEVRVTLDEAFFNKDHVTLSPGGSKTASIKKGIQNGTGTFSAPKASSSNRQGVIEGEIIVGTGT